MTVLFFGRAVPLTASGERSKNVKYEPQSLRNTDRLSVQPGGLSRSDIYRTHEIKI